MAPSKYITLVSAEGYEYVLPREACHASRMLKTSVDPDKNFKENLETVVNLPEMNAVVLEKVVEYLLYWYRYQDKDDVPDMDIPVDMCLELLTAADYLQMDSEHMPQPSSKRS
ncbi:hypothetical protein KVR01_007755 [Diaporthe batatas]|uniref:elongin C n=1 Tax=Diaporthe batatas TaxID=748121 RepID=UPI001D0397D1|nr:elongin C [Diaporthe batatas]KAG8161990.1 hypothetical protein KVR01_007755 [Diaporthe batatas]